MPDKSALQTSIENLNMTSLEIADSLDSFDRTAQMFSDDRPRLLADYRDKWVAAFEGEVVAAADDFQDVLAMLDEKDIPRGSSMVQFIEETDRIMIL